VQQAGALGNHGSASTLTAAPAGLSPTAAAATGSPTRQRPNPRRLKPGTDRTQGGRQTRLPASSVPAHLGPARPPTHQTQIRPHVNPPVKALRRGGAALSRGRHEQKVHGAQHK
jgi:hypothetical protein